MPSSSSLRKCFRSVLGDRMPIRLAIRSCGIPHAAIDFTRLRCSSLGWSFGRGILDLLAGAAALRNFIEAAAMLVQHGAFAGGLLPTSHNHIHIPGTDFP